MSDEEVKLKRLPRSEKKRLAKIKTINNIKSNRSNEKNSLKEKKIVIKEKDLENIPEQFRSTYIINKRQIRRSQFSAYENYLIRNTLHQNNNNNNEKNQNKKDLKVCIDLSYDYSMGVVERKSLISQLNVLMSYLKISFTSFYSTQLDKLLDGKTRYEKIISEKLFADVEKACESFTNIRIDLLFNNVTEQGAVKNKNIGSSNGTPLDTTLDIFNKDNNKSFKVINVAQNKSLTELYKEEIDASKLIILSPDADELLTDVKEDCVYVIGGIVDRTVVKSETKNSAISHELSNCLRRLPLDDIALNQNQPLNIDNVFKILLDTTQNKDELKNSCKANLPKRNRNI